VPENLYMSGIMIDGVFVTNGQHWLKYRNAFVQTSQGAGGGGGSRTVAARSGNGGSDCRSRDGRRCNMSTGDPNLDHAGMRGHMEATYNGALLDGPELGGYCYEDDFTCE